MLERAYPEKISAALGGQQLLGKRSRKLTADQETMLLATQLKLIEEIFFASLATEEGRHARVAVVYIDDMKAALKVKPDYRWQLFALAEPKPYSVEYLAKLSSLCQPGESYLVVTGYRDDMRIVALSRPPQKFEYYLMHCHRIGVTQYLRITATGPGALVLEEGNRESLRTHGGVILKAPPTLFKLVQPERAATRCQALVLVQQSIGLTDSEYFYIGSALLQVMDAIGAAGLGGLVLIQADSALSPVVDAPALQFNPPIDLAKSLKGKILASNWVQAAATELYHLEGSKKAEERSRKAEEEFNAADQALNRMASLVARMALVDGAVVLSHSLRTLGFAAKISVPDNWTSPRVLEVTHHDLAQCKPFDLSRRGTRHRAAVCFADADPGNLALIVSHDGAAAAVFREGDQVLYWPIYLKAHWAGSGPNDF